MPGTLESILSSFAPFVTRMRRIFDILEHSTSGSNYESSITDTCSSGSNIFVENFSIQIRKWIDARIGVYFRRYMNSIQDLSVAHSIYSFLFDTYQIRCESKIFEKLLDPIAPPMMADCDDDGSTRPLSQSKSDQDQLAIYILSHVIEIYRTVQNDVLIEHSNLVPILFDIFTESIRPWIDIIYHMTRYHITL